MSHKVHSYTFFLKSVHCARRLFPLSLIHQTHRNMRTTILLFMISSLFAFFTPYHNTEIITQSFSLPYHTTSIIADLDGEIDIEYWSKDEMQVVTSIVGVASTSDYSMNYMNKKGDFQLKCDYENDMNTLLLRPKRINTTIFRRGQKQKTKQSFKIFIPKRVHCLVN